MKKLLVPEAGPGRRVSLIDRQLQRVISVSLRMLSPKPATDSRESRTGRQTQQLTGSSPQMLNPGPDVDRVDNEAIRTVRLIRAKINNGVLQMADDPEIESAAINPTRPAGAITDGDSGTSSIRTAR